MPRPAFSLAPSRIFYTILFYKFCVLAEFVNEIAGGENLGFQTADFYVFESGYYQIFLLLKYRVITYCATDSFLT